LLLLRDRGSISACEIHPEEYPVLQLMKNHRRAGKGLTMIARMLNERGYRSKKGTLWTAIKVGEAVGTYARARARKKKA